jgi:branched-chain amino acid transport system substrate-binding protein
MESEKKFFYRCLAVLFLLVLIVLGVPQTSRSEAPIKVGVIDSYTGAAAFITKQALNGWNMAVDEFNAKGGLNGRKIEIITRDDKNKADEALAHARELLLKENVDFLGGTINSACALSVSEFARTRKKLFMVITSYSHRITGEMGHRYVFRTCTSADVMGLSGGYFAGTKPFKKWYIIGDDYEFGHSMAENFLKGLKQKNPEAVVIGEAWPKVGETDYTPYLSAMMAQKPDAALGAFGGASHVPFPKQAKMFGLYEKLPFFHYFLADSIFARVLKESYPVGLYTGMSYLWYHPATQANKDFVQKYLDYTTKKGEPEPYAPETVFTAYMGARFLMEGMLKAKSTKTEDVINAMEGLTLESATGPMTMRACDHQVMSPVYWGQLANLPNYPFAVMKDIHAVSAKDVAPSCEEVAQARKGRK